MFQFIRTNILEQWAGKSEAQSRFPVLIRWLLQAHGGKLSWLSVPGDEAVNLPGWDGVSNSESGSAYVPSGSAVWEFSTGQDVLHYANENFSKRTSNPLGVDPTESTFIFVTPRRFSSPSAKAKWIQEKNDLGNWKSVRAYDVEDLVSWLEMSPGVGARFAKEMGIRPTGVQPLESFFQDYCRATNPEITPDILNAGRANTLEKLLTWLEGEPAVYGLRARDPDESIAFLASAIQTLAQGTRETLFAKSVLVNNIEAWEELAAFGNPLLLIPLFDIAQISFGAADGHHVFFSTNAPRFDHLDELQKSPGKEITNALTLAGMKEEKAERLVRESSRSIPILRRLIDRHKVSSPEWSRTDAAPMLAPLILIGEWDDSKEFDRLAVESICGRAYASVTETLMSWSQARHPFAEKIGTVWTLASRSEAWRYLEPYLTTQQLRAYFERFDALLKDTDPKYTLKPEERYLANTMGKSPSYSHRIKKALAETLAIVGSRGSNGMAYEFKRPQDWVDDFLFTLFRRAETPFFWLNLNHLFRFLAEASPDKFLSAIEQDLGGANPRLTELFEVEDGFGGACNYSDLLWALETLAWKKEYLARSVLCLAKASPLYRSGKYVNSPLPSLREIFIPWRRHTLASTEERLQVVDLLVKNCPDQAWHILQSMIPRGQEISHNTRKPAWRIWLDDWDSNVTYAEIHMISRAALERLPTLCGESGDRWGKIIELLNYFPIKAASDTVDRIISASSKIPDDERNALWTRMRKLMSKHNRHRDAPWAFPQEYLDQIKRVYDALSPADPAQKYAWIFDYNPDFHFGNAKDWEVGRKEIHEVQEAAAEEIALLGLATVVKVAEAAKTPGMLGACIAQNGLSEPWESFFVEGITRENKKIRELSFGYASKVFEKKGWPWLRGYLSEGPARGWTAEAKAALLQIPSFDAKTWEFATECGDDVEQAYWKIVPTCLTTSVEDAALAMKNFLMYARPWQALETASIYALQEKEISGGLIKRILEAVIRLDFSNKEDVDRLSENSYQISELIAYLSKTDIDQKEMAQLEWSWLPVLQGNFQHPLVLHDWMTKDPEFFMEVISLCFRKEGDDSPIPEENRARAKHAYELLYEWSRLPGLDPEGNLDGSILREWWNRVISLSDEMKRRKITELKLGTMLSRSPDGRDGFWPHEEIRDIIEQCASDEISRGFTMGKRNSRGVTTRALDEGGAQERVLVEYFNTQATNLVGKYPRTAAILRDLASDYERDAKEEDVRAKLRFS